MFSSDYYELLILKILNGLVLVHIKMEGRRSKPREFLLIFSFTKQYLCSGKVKLHICTFNSISGFLTRFDFYFDKQRLGFFPSVAVGIVTDNFNGSGFNLSSILSLAVVRVGSYPTL